MVNPNKELDMGSRPRVEADPAPVLNKLISDELAKPSDIAPEHVAISAVVEIEKLMADLVSAKDYLKGEAERIQRETARLRGLSKAALASVHLVSGNLNKWRGDQKEAA